MERYSKIGKRATPIGGRLAGSKTKMRNSKTLRTMKKTFQILCAAMLALAVIGCENDPIEEGNTPAIPDEPTEEPVEPSEPSEPSEPTELVLRANLPETRTTLSSDFKLSWNKSDVMAVFNAPAGTEDYSGNLKFEIDENAEGKFTPAEGVEVTFEEGTNYDWYVLYPYRPSGNTTELKSPKGESGEDGYFPIGAQTQTGYDSSTHVASQDVMVGKATNTRTPEVTLKHLAVLHKFTITNKSDKPTVIEKLTLNGGENKIFGTFWIDLRADNPAIDITKANATFNERALTVKEGTELAVDASADFYVVTAPFVLNAGETFKITIKTSTGEQVVEKTAESDITFAAGTYNTASLVYDYIAPSAVATDHLFSDTFESNFSNKVGVGTGNTTMSPQRWDTYDYSSVLVYDGDTSNVKYSYEGNVTVNCQAASVIVGMEGFFVWFKTNAKLMLNNIKLHEYTDLTLSFNQTYKSSKIKCEYSVDGGSTWVEIGTTAHPAGNSMATYSFDFNVPVGSETINLRFTALTDGPRMDNVKLTWQE